MHGLVGVEHSNGLAPRNDGGVDELPTQKGKAHVVAHVEQADPDSGREEGGGSVKGELQRGRSMQERGKTCVFVFAVLSCAMLCFACCVQPASECPRQQRSLSSALTPSCPRPGPCALPHDAQMRI
jgi:hypothetical protein